MVKPCLRPPAARSMSNPSSLSGLGRSAGRWDCLAMPEDDRLSELPDDVLLNIVERLDIADTARASVLSRRWKQIPAMLSRIAITAACPEANATVLEATRSILGNRITTAAGRRGDHPYAIRSMRLQFFLGYEAVSIAQTAAGAMAAHDVGSAEFTILAKLRTQRTGENLLVTLGTQFVSLIDACPDAFAGLTRLNLESLVLPDDQAAGLPGVLGLCKRLEHLRLHHCVLGSLLQLEHPQLSELEIVSCGFKGRVDLKWLPKLKVLTFDRWMSQYDPFSLGYVPLLESMRIARIGRSADKMLKLSELLGDHAAMIDLHLNFEYERIWVKPEGGKQLSMVFNRLKLVNLMNVSEECDLNWTMFILQGAPSLEELRITVQDHWCEMITGDWRKLYALSKKKKDKEVAEWKTSLGLKHNNLSVLRIFGFQAQDEKFMSYIKGVMEATVNLQDIYLYDKPLCWRCKRRVRKTSMYPRTRKKRSLITNKINKGACSLVKVHFPKYNN